MDLLPVIINLLEGPETSGSSSESSTDSEVEEYARIVRIEGYIERVVVNYSETTFKSHFRMHKLIVYQLASRLENSGFIPVHEHGKMKISSEKAMLMTLWYLGNTESFRQVSDRFDVSLSSAHRVIERVLNCILSLRTEYIKWPTQEETEVISKAFATKFGSQNVIGAIDGCHVRIRRPKNDQDSYINRKGYFSLLIQGTVNSFRQFIDVYCGEPGSLHDARLLRRSSLYSKAENNVNFFGNKYLLGDSAYPSLSWLVPPFKDNGALSNNQKVFNFKHSSTRIIVEHVFRLLKGRFRRLQHLENLNINICVKIMMACCVLHNICESKHDNTVIEPYDISSDVNSEIPLQSDVKNVTRHWREQIFEEMFS
ncbi:hypothetical protein PPYR_01534 [Photinus pyralis]|uniref:Uncharacterized protein n=1 Tax=Photinus pyralis TaxID=7054 RepID=A0A5N4B4T4_PHOPY|nr:hypothetical protein PPYR_01534 [Photinus pyralis]